MRNDSWSRAGREKSAYWGGEPGTLAIVSKKKAEEEIAFFPGRVEKGTMTTAIAAPRHEQFRSGDGSAMARRGGFGEQGFHSLIQGPPGT